MLLHFLDTTGKHFFHQSIDDFDTGQVAFVYRAISRLSGKGFLMQGAIAVTIKKTADLVFQFSNAHDCLFTQAPRHVLIG